MSAARQRLRPDTEENFVKLCRIELSNGVPVEKYVSKRTGLKVILAKVEGPVVSGYFVLGTEAKSDDGLPHTLEHLVFLGSEKYPYKGVLDLLANRCLAAGTNAWTAPDHTAYTIETAGSEGFLNLMPIYLDHLLYPTLTDSGFTTEVHHITGTGNDAGVVYSEMQSRENTDYGRSIRAVHHAFYPESCGYRYETGGILKNLRNSTSIQKIRAYHKAFYRTENLHLVITGQVEAQDLFDVLQEFEDGVIAKEEELPPFQRPWQRPVPPFEESVVKEIVYPSGQLDNGKVLVAWRGPSSVNSYRKLLSVEVLLQYLTYSSVSPLLAAFVERDDPLASQVVQYCSEDKAPMCLLGFFGVPLDKIDRVEPQLRSTLSSLHTSSSVGIELSAIQEVLKNLILSTQSSLESSPRKTLAFAIIGDALYGDQCSDLEHRLDKVSWYSELLTKPLGYWRDLLRDVLIENPSVVVLARPSKREAMKLWMEKERRVTERRKLLGEEGLKEKGDALIRAEQINEVPPPASMLSSLPIPSPFSVNFHPLVAYSNHPRHDSSMATTPNNHPSFNLTALPLRFQLDDINSNFVTLTAILDSSSLSSSERMFLPLVLEVILDSGLLKDGVTEMPYETVVRGLTSDLMSYSAQMGLAISAIGSFTCGPFCNYANVVMKMELKKYPEGVSWLHDVLYNLRPSVSRLAVKTTKLLNSVGDNKRSPEKILSLLYKRVMFDPDSNQNRISLLRQQRFLTQLSDRLQNDNQSAEVLEEFTAVLSRLTRPSSLTVHMATNVMKLAQITDVAAPWLQFVKQKNFGASTRRFKVVRDSESRAFRGLWSTNPARALNSEDMKSSKEIGDPEQAKIGLPEMVDNEDFTSRFEVAADVGAATEDAKDDDGWPQSWVVGLSSADSGYLQQSAISLSQHTHWDLPALMTAIQYFTQLEGPMWKEIRGKGLAYNYNLEVLPSEGVITLKLHKAARLLDAYKEAINLLASHMNGSQAYDPLLLESAKSSLLFEVIYREEAVSDVVQQSLLAYYRGVPHSYNRDLLSHISRVTLADVERVSAQYFSPLLQPLNSRTVVVCPPADVQETVAALQILGHRVDEVKALENSSFS